MAAPHVSGSIAAFLSVRREFIGQTARVKGIFTTTTTTTDANLDLLGPGRHLLHPACGEAYLRDLPDAELVRLDSGHFAVEDCLDQISADIKKFYDTKVVAALASSTV